ncbi:hypothetical protein BK007_05620 [Methanobacterium subterraneum]|jgi:hypothetical protein|uniref:Lipoprotein n=1 Tax=Methanobacterium subterraneum TaxID=59277 RepID=A0A2H4VBS3_9EURY|nr:hypothetical protein [Methanobacterium subterraneum]AUB55541.1 hypothetical protein BK007_05620 [Methanobacterium subterraneum]
MSKKIEIGLIVVFVCFIVAVSGCNSFDPVKVVINYTGSWNGTITDESGTRTIEGAGDKTIDLGSISGSVKVKVDKKDNNSDLLTASILRGDKTVSSMNTTSDYVITTIYLTR